MTHPLILKLQRRDDISTEEVAVLERLPMHSVEFKSGADIVKQGSRPTESCLLIEGFAARYTLLKEGARQITAIHLNGDFVDLHSFLLKKMDHGVLAVTNCSVALVPHARLKELSEQYPHLARLLWLTTLIDAATHREWLAAMGRRTAEAHLAHLICELYTRLLDAGRAADHSFDLPLTQEQLADTLGLSSVHVNRVLQRLRGDALISWRDGIVHIHDWDKLAAFAEFDDTYLNLLHEPR